MSRNDPLQNPSGTGMTGDPLARPGQGTARVETRVTGAQGTTGARTSTGTGTGDEGLLDRAQDQVKETWDDVRERADDLTDRASEMASRAQSQIGDALNRAEHQLEEKTGAVSMVRNNPLAAAGLAFGIGFLLAGDGGGRSRKRRGGMVGKAGGQLRNVIVGGVSTMLMQELQEMLDEHGGPMGLLNTLMGRDTDQQRQPSQPQPPRY
jgi:ElaB/YqjD/DUF883 family membrane-anchored ribosome-binding protein